MFLESQPTFGVFTMSSDHICLTATLLPLGGSKYIILADGGKSHCGSVLYTKQTPQAFLPCCIFGCCFQAWIPCLSEKCRQLWPRCHLSEMLPSPGQLGVCLSSLYTAASWPLTALGPMAADLAGNEIIKSYFKLKPASV